MANITTNSKNPITSSDHKTNGPLPTRVGVIFVVEAIEAEQENKSQSKSKKYDQRLLEPSFEPFSQLFYLVIGYLLIALIACVLWSIPVSVIPMTNTIAHPWYWWEIILNGMFFVTAMSYTGMTMAEMKIIFDFKLPRLLTLFIWSFVLQFLATAGPWCLCYLVWTFLLEKNHPMPFVGYFCYIFSYLTHFASMWFMFPNEMRETKKGRGKIFAYISYRILDFIIVLQRVVIGVIMGKLKQIQWIMGIVLPLSREINLWLQKKIWKKLDKSGDDNLIIFNLTATILINLQHACFVAITISTKASFSTTICILAVDVSLNLYETYTIIKRSLLVSSSSTSQEERNALKMDALTLCGIEMVEFLTPIAYTVSFIMAFYGTNADLIGGVKFSDWQYEEVEDIAAFLTESGMMFIADFTCAVASGILLRKFASINMLEEGYKLLRLFWPAISIRLAGIMFMVIIYRYN